jgi:O-antigen/teichoic acid export membrane protein
MSGSEREAGTEGDATSPQLGPEPTAGVAEVTSMRTLVTGGLWSTAARVIPQLYTLVVLVFAARYLGDDGLGRQSYIAFVELSVVMLVTAGMPTSLMRHVGEAIGAGRGPTVRSLARWAWAVEAVAALVGAGILAAIAFAGADPQAAWALAAVATAMGVLHTVPTAFLLGSQRWREAAVAGLAVGTLATPATIGVLVAGGGITGMFAVEAAASVLILVWTTVLARRALRDIAPSPAPDPVLRRRVLRYAAFASLGVILTFVVWRRSEFFFLQRYSTYRQLALYSICFSFVNALVRVFEAVIAVVTPAVATLYGAGAIETIRSGYGRALRLLLLGTLPAAALSAALAPDLLSRLLGPDFHGIGTILVVMMITFPFVPLVKTGTGVLHGLGRIRFILLSGAFAAIVNVGLDVVLIPRWNAVGAAVANGGAQLAAAIPVLVYGARTLGGIRLQPAFLLRTIPATAGAGLVAWAADKAIGGGFGGVAAGTAAGLAALAGLSVLLRILPAEDAAWIDGLVGARLGGSVGRACRLLSARAA